MRSGFAKMTMANKLGSKIAWIAEKKVTYMFIKMIVHISFSIQWIT